MTLRRMAILGCFCVFLAGCGTPAADTPVSLPDQTPVDDHSGHNHAHHDHATMVGPHGGHVLELGHEEYHAEWLHDDEAGKLTIYILDGAGEKEVPVYLESVIIETEIEGGESKNYTLEGIDPADDKTAHFEIVDPALLTTIKVSGEEGATATLKTTIDGVRFKAKFVHHHHGDGHDGHKH